MFHAMHKLVFRSNIGSRIALAQRVKVYMQLVPNKYKDFFFFVVNRQFYKVAMYAWDGQFSTLYPLLLLSLVLKILQSYYLSP